MDLDQLAEQVVTRLAQQEVRLVLAESCSGGLVAATLTQVPGVSQHFCGSMVVYQEATKSKWLGVAAETLDQHTAVSAPVAHQMAAGVLAATPHADVAVSVTGHLGPNAPDGFDAVVFVGAVRRGAAVRVSRHELASGKRLRRQREAAALVLQAVLDALAGPPS